MIFQTGTIHCTPSRISLVFAASHGKTQSCRGSFLLNGLFHHVSSTWLEKGCQVVWVSWGVVGGTNGWLEERFYYHVWCQEGPVSSTACFCAQFPTKGAAKNKLIENGTRLRIFKRKMWSRGFGWAWGAVHGAEGVLSRVGSWIRWIGLSHNVMVLFVALTRV